MRWSTLAAAAAFGCTQPLPAETEQRFMPHSTAVLELTEGDDELDTIFFDAPYLPLRSPGDRPDVTVYGFWPHWGDPLATLPWDQLTHVAIFSVTLKSDGSLADEHYWHDNVADALALAAPYDVKVHLTVTSFDDSVMGSVLGSSSRRATAVTNLARLVNDAGAHGVNIDFEGMDAWLSDELVLFTEALSAEVDEVTLATPAADWNGSYDYDALAAASDGLFIMGYDYSWSGGDPGPVAPLEGEEYGIIDLKWTLADYEKYGAKPEDIIMGLPLYGRGWNTTDNSIPGRSTGGSWSEVYSESRQTGIDHGRHYDAEAAVAYAFPSGSSQVFYDDVTSLSEKIEWALAEGVAGVGFWALTYDNTDPVLWAEIDKHTHDGVAPSTVPVVEPAVPGEADTDNEVVVVGVEPGHQVHLLWADAQGTYAVPGCGFDVELDAPVLLDSVTADGAGEARFLFPVKLEDAERDVVLLAVDVDGCEASVPVITRFADPGSGTGGTTTEPTEPTETEPVEPAVHEVCYPGDDLQYDVCAELDPAGHQGAAYDYPSSSSSNYAKPTWLLELSRVPGDTKVAPNFTRDELAQEWKGTYGVVQVHAVERLQDLRDEVGALRVTSGYRNPSYNASVGGATFSRHMYGDAFDLQPLSTSLSALSSACSRHGAGFVSVYTSHVHCDWRDDAQEAAFYGSAAPPPPAPTAATHRAAVVPSLAGLLTAPAEGFDCGEPLREWVAFDADGRVIAEATGATFDPPSGAVEVEVTVGRVVTERVLLH